MMDERDTTGKFIKGHKGQGGRPKGALSINDELRKLLNKKLKDVDPALVAKIAEKNPQFAKEYGDQKTIEALAVSIIRKALAGDPAQTIQLWQQMEGKPKQQIDVGGQEGNPIIVLRKADKNE